MALKEAMERVLARQRQRKLNEARRSEREQRKLQLIVGRNVVFEDR